MWELALVSILLDLSRERERESQNYVRLSHYHSSISLRHFCRGLDKYRSYSRYVMLHNIDIYSLSVLELLLTCTIHTSPGFAETYTV